MKTYISAFAIALAGMAVTTGCVEEFQPEDGSASSTQVAEAPGYYESAVKALTETFSGSFLKSNKPGYDFGYTALYLQRDLMGNDIINPSSGTWVVWYRNFTGLNARYAYCSYPWDAYYGWIRSCNNVLTLSGENPSGDRAWGKGQAHAIRAMLYMELAQMYAPETYGVNKEALTVPIVTEKPSLEENPRVTNKVMWDFILGDLDEAETLLKDYVRPDIYTPDISVVYGLKARAYLVMCDWKNAETYAKLAQNGYTMMSADQYTDRGTGFNTPNQAWMMATRFDQNSDNIQLADGEKCWASWITLETNGSGCGEASMWGCPCIIDRHLYSTIPATDIRRKVFVDFAIDGMTKDDQLEALKAYTDFPDWIYSSGQETYAEGVGGLTLKFRAAGGSEGHYNQRIAFSVSVPMMRVEEMMLIEAEAAGMQDAARGKQLLETFAKKRDPNYVYGTHNEAYYNASTPAFQNEVWWQRRVELWGEGFATLDIKRLGKGVIRSYPGSNHMDNYRWNSETMPLWMIAVIPTTETNNNEGIINNPAITTPKGNSPEFTF